MRLSRANGVVYALAWMLLTSDAPAATPELPAPGPRQPAAQFSIAPVDVGAPPKPIFDPRSYGAKADGVTFDTAALQQAIDACTSTGGSVYLSKGRFLTAPLTLKSQMTFFIEKGAVLLASTRPEDYPVTLPEGAKNSVLCRQLLLAVHADHLVLDGEGTIDGQGQKLPMTGKEPNRPSLIHFYASSEVTVRNLTIENPRMWTQIYTRCNHLLIDHEIVNSPPKYCPNLDGMDIYDCSDATVRNCRVNSDDDSICIKSGEPAGLHDITIENNIIRNTGANAIKMGTATSGPISGIHILNNTILSAALGGLCIESVDGSAVSDVTVRGLDIYRTKQPIFIRLAHRSGTPGSITGVTIENVRAIADKGDGASVCTITGIPEAHIGNVSIRNCYFELPGGAASLPATAPAEKATVYPQSNLLGTVPAWAFYIRHADGVTLDRVVVARHKADARPWLNSSDAKVHAIDCRDLQQVEPAKIPVD
jgi:hypothetical protein